MDLLTIPIASQAGRQDIECSAIACSAVLGRRANAKKVPRVLSLDLSESVIGTSQIIKIENFWHDHSNF